MAIQVIEDGKGNPAGVFIPINKWKELKKQHKELERLENEEPATKDRIFQVIKDSIKEVNLIKAGKIKGIAAKDLLNEL